LKKNIRIISVILLLSFTLCNCGKSIGIEGHLLILAKKDSLFGIWDITNNDWFIDNKYAKLNTFAEGLVAFKKAKKWGFIDTTGKEIIAPIYDDVHEDGFRYGYAYVKLNDKWSIINKLGKEIVTTPFDNVGGYNEGFYSVKWGSSYNFATPDGKVLYPNWFSYTTFFSGGYASGGIRLTSETTVDCIIDENGRVNWCDSMFFNIYPFSEGIARATLKKNYHCVTIDTSGKILFVSTNPYMMMGRGTSGTPYVIVSTNPPAYEKVKYGVISPAGKIVVDTIYDDVGRESEGLITIKKDGKWGIIDTAGNILLSPSFNFIGHLEDGIAIASEDGKKYGFVDKTGQWVIPANFDNICNYENGFATVSNNDKYGLIDKKGNWIIPCNYAFLSSVATYDCLIYKRDGKVGIVDINSKELTLPIFEHFSTNVEKMLNGTMIPSE
jgi:WG containing repeat